MPKAKLVTRTATSSTITDDNLNKASALTHAEMDSNLINLRDSSFGIADDSSTVLQVTHDKTITVAGGTGITTALSGDTLTITNSGGDITSVVAGDGLANGGTTGDVTLNIGAGTGIDVAADAISVDVSDFLTNGSDNRVVTATGTDALNGEANLTFDGSTLTLTGSAALDGVTIADNEITTNASNADMVISANGSGKVLVSSDGNDSTVLGNNPRNVLLRKDHAETFGTRSYANWILQDIKIDSGESDSSSSNDRWRNISQITLDLNGKDSTATSSSVTRGPQNAAFARVANGASTDSTLGNANGGQNVVVGSTNSTGNLTFTETAGHSALHETSVNSGTTVTFTKAHGYFSGGLIGSGSGTTSCPEYNHFFAKGSSTTPTAEYMINTDTDTLKSKLGSIERYREQINALSFSSSITVDANTAPIHTVTLAGNTDFQITNLGTGQSITLIITSDSTGSYTATFGDSSSTAVKFAGGSPTLTSAGGSIDVVTIFNDGTNILGSFAGDFKTA